MSVTLQPAANPRHQEIPVKNRRTIRATLAAFVGTLALAGGLFATPTTASASTINAITATIPVGLGAAPIAITYDSTNGDIYVAEMQDNAVSVIDPATNTVIDTIDVGQYPEAITYDSANGDIYVANYDSGTVSVIDGATSTVIDTVSVGSYPNLLLYDPANGNIYVAVGGINLVVVNGSSNAVTSTIGGMGYPAGLLYDPVNGDIYINSENSVWVMDPATGAITTEIYPPSQVFTIDGIVYDPTNGDIYATTSPWDNALGGSTGYDSIWDISTATNTITSITPVGSAPGTLAYDPVTNDLYVMYQTDISVVNPATIAAVTAIGTASIGSAGVYDPSNGGIYVAEINDGVVIVIDGGAGTASVTVGPNPPPGTATSSLDPGVLSFVSTPGNLTFPAVTLDGTNQSTSASLPLDIGDNTGTGAGWNVTITSTSFSDGSVTLPASATSVDAAPSASCDVGASCTPATLSSSVTYPLTVPAGATAPTATRLYSAAAGSGMGDQTISPDFTLAVPADAAAGAYSSDWTLSLVSGP